MLKKIRNILAAILIIGISYFGTSYINQLIIDYKKYSIEANLQIGAPSYHGPCPEVIKNINIALQNDRYLSQHLSVDGKENLKFYKTHILGYINGSFSFAQTCQDTEAVGRLLYTASNITLDLAIDKAMTYKEAVYLAQSYLNQAKHIGYSQAHPSETIFLQGRIDRNTFRMKAAANV